MTDIFEEWFKRIELRLKYELSPELYERIMNVMLSELRMLYEEEKLKEKKNIESIRNKYMKES